MAFSLLYKKGSASATTSIDSTVLYHFSLDRLVSNICADVKKRDIFLSVVSSLNSDVEEIIYRREILRDLLDNRDLLREFSALYKIFSELKDVQQRTHKEEFRISFSGMSSLGATRNILQNNAHCAMRALLFVKAFGELLSRYDLKSRGLLYFNHICQAIYANDEYEKLLQACRCYATFSESDSHNFRFLINTSGRIEQYDLVYPEHIHITDPDLKSKKGSLFKKVNQERHPSNRVYPRKNNYYEALEEGALKNLSSLFATIFNQIFEHFALLGEELVFYEVALKYIDTLNVKGGGVCFPRLKATGKTEVKKLYDLFLLVSSPNVSQLVPNDVSWSHNGLVIFGDNSSGKTTYLRSIGTMQILAQAGLPIPCETADIVVCTQILTQFSESEKGFVVGNDAGRFEQEVRDLAKLVDSLQNGALVFLNETFQSTDYSEGAEGLYYLLNHLSSCGVHWILVTHLHQLLNIGMKDNVSVGYMEGYCVNIDK